MYEELKRGDKKVAVIGLGYVGLPLALQLASTYKVIGYDINRDRIRMMKDGIDPSRELERDVFIDRDIVFTSEIEDLKEASFFIIAVPTPIDKHKVPNLQPLFNASGAVGKVIKKGGCVVFESTVYPGCTEEDCIPVIEEASGLRAGVDFSYGYSPERINPGDKLHTVDRIVKVVSGNDANSLELIANVYGQAIKAGIYKAASVKVAEAAKVIENTQRDLNIAFMNELSIIFDKMEIDTRDVLEAASTKWNFLPFQPGLVGGHCIGVDPYYLTYKAKKIGYDPEVILSGRRINDGMPGYVAKKLVQLMLGKEIDLKKARVLVMGVTFKENVSDIRNSKVMDLIKELEAYSLKVDAIDPFANPQEVSEIYGLELLNKPEGPYEAIIAAVSHAPYLEMEGEVLEKLLVTDGIVMDIKGIYKGKFNGITYWRM